MRGHGLSFRRRRAVIFLRRQDRKRRGFCTNPSCEFYGNSFPGGCDHSPIDEGKEDPAFFRCKDEYCPNYHPDALYVCPMEHSGGPDPDFPPDPEPDGGRRA
jgi:hypothetical protein